MKKQAMIKRFFALALALALAFGGLTLTLAAPARAEAAVEENAKKPTSVKLNKAKADMKVGQKLQLTARVKPWYAETKLTWKSSNPAVAKVSRKGLVTAKGVGTAKITVTTSNRKKASMVVTVSEFRIEDLPADRYRYFRKYMSDDEFRQAYSIAVRKVVTPLWGLSRKDQLYGIAQKLRQMMPAYSMEARHYNDPYGYFVLGAASCAGCTRTTGLCLNILGIPYEHVNENQYSHQWARVQVGGQYWICDAYGLYCGPEPAPYRHPYLN